jgi:hypothetical protein
VRPVRLPPGYRFDGERLTAKNAPYCINSISLTLDPSE